MHKRIYGHSMQTNTGCTSEYMGVACRLSLDAHTYIWAKHVDTHWMYKRIYGLSIQTNNRCTNVYMGLAYRLTTDVQTYIWS